MQICRFNKCSPRSGIACKPQLLESRVQMNGLRTVAPCQHECHWKGCETLYHFVLFVGDALQKHALRP